MSGVLFVVGTPIGNLGDITARALEVLRSVSFIVCEDTRHSRSLLTHFGISRETLSLPAFAERQRAGRILERLASGEDCALITDAGSPGISDPGQALVSAAIERSIRVSPVPGASAAIAALTVSGLPTARFHFLGFLPRKGADRAELLADVESLRATLVMFESPQRLAESLDALCAALGPRRACVARELTKVHEELVRGTLAELADRCRGQQVRGEVAIVVEGCAEVGRWSEEEVSSALTEGIAEGKHLKELSRTLAERSGWKAQELYRLGLSLRKP